jgi:hypothetical protein
MNDFPYLNPSLPAAVDIGESRSWLYPLRNMVAAILATRAVETGSADTLIGEVSLGSGEQSPPRRCLPTTSVSPPNHATAKKPPDY